MLVLPLSPYQAGLGIVLAHTSPVRLLLPVLITELSSS